MLLDILPRNACARLMLVRASAISVAPNVPLRCFDDSKGGVDTFSGKGGEGADLNTWT